METDDNAMMARRSAILTYHSLDSSGSVISTTPDLFASQMEWLASSGVPVVPLLNIREKPGAVALTFDDGYRNFLSSGWPVLRDYGFPATVFVVSDYCGRTNDWSNQGRLVPRLPLMSYDELRELASKGVAIGSHSARHPDLSEVEASRVVEELRGSRAFLEDKLGGAVRTFAYPYGASTPAIRALAVQEFAMCCGTRLAFAAQDSDTGDLPRLDVYYLRQMFWWKRLMRSTGTAYVAVRRVLRGLRP